MSCCPGLESCEFDRLPVEPVRTCATNEQNKQNRDERLNDVVISHFTYCGDRPTWNPSRFVDLDCTFPSVKNRCAHSVELPPSDHHLNVNVWFRSFVYPHLRIYTAIEMENCRCKWNKYWNVRELLIRTLSVPVVLSQNSIFPSAQPITIKLSI